MYPPLPASWLSLSNRALSLLLHCLRLRQLRTLLWQWSGCPVLRPCLPDQCPCWSRVLQDHTVAAAAGWPLDNSYIRLSLKKASKIVQPYKLEWSSTFCFQQQIQLWTIVIGECWNEQTYVDFFPCGLLSSWNALVQFIESKRYVAGMVFVAIFPSIEVLIQDYMKHSSAWQIVIRQPYYWVWIMVCHVMQHTA